MLAFVDADCEVPPVFLGIGGGPLPAKLLLDEKKAAIPTGQGVGWIFGASFSRCKGRFQSLECFKGGFWFWFGCYGNGLWLSGSQGLQPFAVSFLLENPLPLVSFCLIREALLLGLLLGVFFLLPLVGSIHSEDRGQKHNDDDKVTKKRPVGAYIYLHLRCSHRSGLCR